MVAVPLELPMAVLDPAVGAVTLAEVALFACAFVPLNAKPLLTTPAVDSVPINALLLISTFPTFPPLPTPTLPIMNDGFMAFAECPEVAVPF